jgi:hypothetical protein
MTKKTPQEPYSVLATAIVQLSKTGADNEAMRDVARVAARIAPPSVRAKFSRRDANVQLGKFLRFEAEHIANQRYDMGSIHLRIDSHLRDPRNGEDAKKALRAITSLQRGEMVASLLRAARKAETTDLSEHELQQAIAARLVPTPPTRDDE